MTPNHSYNIISKYHIRSIYIYIHTKYIHNSSVRNPGNVAYLYNSSSSDDVKRPHHHKLQEATVFTILLLLYQVQHSCTMQYRYTTATALLYIALSIKCSTEYPLLFFHVWRPCPCRPQCSRYRKYHTLLYGERRCRRFAALFLEASLDILLFVVYVCTLPVVWYGMIWYIQQNTTYMSMHLKHTSVLRTSYPIRNLSALHLFECSKRILSGYSSHTAVVVPSVACS